MKSKGILKAAWEACASVSDPLLVSVLFKEWPKLDRDKETGLQVSNAAYLKLYGKMTLSVPFAMVQIGLEFAAKKNGNPIDIEGYYKRNPKYAITRAQAKKSR